MRYTYEDLYNNVGKFLGTYGDSGLSAGDLALAKDLVKSGYNEFLQSYPWSFLRKNTTLTCQAGEHSYNMPEDFSYLVLPFSYKNNSGYPPVTNRSENEIIELRNLNEITSWPQYFAIRQGQYTPEAGSIKEVIFWPTPDSSYVLYYTYRFQPVGLVNTTDYPVGGAEMAECILQFCLKAAEEKEDETSEGIQTRRAITMLGQAISMDKENDPKQLGYNGSGSPILTSWEVARGSYRVNDVNYNL